MGLTLYEIDERIRDLVDCETGEISEENLEALEMLEMDREQKLLAYACVIRELSIESKAVAEEAKRMRERAAGIQSRADQLRQKLAEALGTGQKMKDHRVSIYWTGARTKIVPNDPEALPSHLLRISVAPNASLIAEAFHDAEHPLHAAAIDLAHEEEIPRSIVIR